MKIVKLLMMIIIIALFSSGNAFTQNRRTAWTITSPYIGTAACGSESVIGTWKQDWKLWEGQEYPVKTSWPLVGETSGAFYEAKAIESSRSIVMPGAGSNGTFTHTFHIKRNGVLIAFWHVTYHYTLTPDGELQQ